MKAIFIFIGFLFFINVNAQTKLFNVVTQNLNLPDKGNAFYSLTSKDKYFFEDENYIVTDSCRGEFGGSVFFKNKKTGNTYVGAATCALIMNKIKNSYYLTTSLAHLSGSCGLYEISNPEDLVQITNNDTLGIYKKRSEIGIKPLYKVFGTTIIASFEYNEKIYSIFSDRSRTYIAERKNAEMIEVQEILDYEIYSYAARVKKTDSGHYLAIFQTQGKQGYIDIFKNEIHITLYN